MTTAASTADRVREQSEASLSEITRALELLVAPGDVHELRVLGTVKGNGSGYFDDLGTFADTAAKAGDSRLNASGVYFTMNPCQWPAENRIESNPKRATRDDEIVARRWLLIDCDVQREITIRTLDGEEKRETKSPRRTLNTPLRSSVHWRCELSLPASDGPRRFTAIRATARICSIGSTCRTIPQQRRL